MNDIVLTAKDLLIIKGLDKLIKRELRLIKKRKWRTDNLDKIKISAAKTRLKYKDRYYKEQRERYHNSKPEILEYYRKRTKERYWNNDDHREKKLEQQKEYYHTHKEYFREHRRKPEIKQWHKEYKQRPEVIKRRKKWLAENKDKTKASAAKYRLKNREKIKLDHINQVRIKNGIQLSESIEQHFEDRKQTWYKKIVYSHLYKDN